MSTAIKTVYKGATAHSGSRIVATTMDSGTKMFCVVEYSHLYDSAMNHTRAFLKLANKLEWKGEYVTGGTAEGYVFVRTNGDKVLV